MHFTLYNITKTFLICLIVMIVGTALSSGLTYCSLELLSYISDHKDTLVFSVAWIGLIIGFVGGIAGSAGILAALTLPWFSLFPVVLGFLTNPSK